MKKTKYLNKTLIGIMGTLGLGGAAVGGGILAYTNANVDQLEVLTRAVRDNTVEQYKARAKRDIIVELGNFFSAAIIDDKLYTWGDNAKGQLGLGDIKQRDLPIEVKEMSDGTNTIPIGTVTQITLGGDHSAAIINGKLYTWGDNSRGQLGLGDNVDRNIPTEVKNMSDGTTTTPIGTVTQMSLGGKSSFSSFGGYSAAIINGKLYTWGDNSRGQLGLGDTKQRYLPTEVKNMSDGTTTTPIGTVTQITLGGGHSAAIINGRLYTWGYNNSGQLGLGIGDSKNRIVPTEVKNMSDGTTTTPIGTATQISLGEYHSAALINDELYAWGYNFYGQSGIVGMISIIDVPTKVTQMSTNGTNRVPIGTVTQFSLDGNHSAAIINGKFYTWGYSVQGQLGLGDDKNRIVPTEVKEMSDGTNTIPIGTVTQFSLGGNHSAAIIDKKVYIWGGYHRGQLGNGQTTSISSFPTEVAALAKDKDITLDANNDPAKLRDDIVYNIDTTELESLIDHSKATIGIDPADTYTITNRNNTATLDSIKKGQISVEVNTTPSNKKINVKFKGFKPVNETQSIPAFSKTITSAPSGEINDLVAKANADTTGTTSILARWIIDTNNRTQIIGDVTTKYTENFPLNTRITKVSDFTVVNGTDGQISFKIEVDKYYKKSGNDLIESVAGDGTITLTNKITLSGFDATKESAIGVISTSDRNFTAKQLLDDFGFANETTAITGLVELKKYLTDLDNFPTNTAFKIVDKIVTTDPITKKATLAFRIVVDKYFDNTGIQVNQDKTFNTDKLEISGLNDSTSSITRNGTIGPNTLNATDLLASFGGENTDITPKQKTALEKYLDFSNFSTSTKFQITNALKNGTTLTFKVSADRHFDASGTETIGNKVFPGTGAFEIRGLKDSTSSISRNTTHGPNILNATDLLASFGGVDTIIKPAQKAELENYLVFSNFPGITEFKIIDAIKTGTTLTFRVSANRSTDASGTETIADKVFPGTGANDIFTITGLKDSTSSISRNTTHGPNTINATDLLASFGGENKTFTPLQKAELEKYLNFSNFPGNTEFKITDAVKTGTTLRFKVSANRSTDASGTETIADKVFPGNLSTDVFIIDNLKDSTTKQPALISPNSPLTPKAILADMGYNPQGGSVTKVGLEQYFTNIDTFPPTATYQLRDLAETPTTLTFKIYASTYWDASGTEIQNFISAAPYTITGVLNASTTVSVVPGYNTDILSGDLWNSFNVQSGGSWNEASTNPYFLIQDKAQGATFTMQKLAHSAGNLSLRITASSHIENGIVVLQPKPYNIQITGLISAEDSINAKFQKDIISGDGALISQQIETQITVGSTISSNNQLLQDIANTAAYPPNTTFTIDAVTKPIDKVIFKTFSIDLSADKFYQDQTTMIGAHPRTISIDNLKFSPTKWSRMARVLPDIKNEQFITYVNYDDATGTFDHVRLQEFFILENFDLTTPDATRMINARIENNEIKFTLAVTHYVDQNGIGQNAPTTYDLSIDLNNSVGVLPGTGTGTDTGIGDKTTETIILATSIAGGVFLLFLLLLLLLLLIRRKRHMAEHYMIVSNNNNESGNRSWRNNKTAKRNKGNGEYDQFWIDHQEDLRRANSKKD